MIITERRIVTQDWYETETTKTGWDSNGWVFNDDCRQVGESWTIVKYLNSDKYGNPTLGIAERESVVTPA